jgi:cytochrome P450
MRTLISQGEAATMEQATAPVEGAEIDDGDPFAGMDPETAAHPQDMFKALRDDMPVMPVDGVGWVVTRKADVEEVLKHPEIYSSNADAVDLKNIRPLIPLQIDPPEHKKFRKLLDPIFAPREVAKLEEILTDAVNELIDRFIERGSVDFAKEFSTLYPTRVFLNLLGLPVEELPTFLVMKDGIIRPNHVTGTSYTSPEANDYQQQTADSVYAYFDKVLDLREVERQDDILSRFLDATVDGERLSREDILDICFLFLIAGLDTVTATLDCIFGYLVHHPDQRQRIVDDESIIPAVVEELLRWETPVMGVVRVAAEDTEVGGCPVKKDEKVMVMLGSVNTDERDLPDADVVRFDREVNRHVAFGGGVHRCLGSHLARLELRVALREWHRRIPEYRLVDDHQLAYTPGIRSIDYFPMEFTAAP